MISTEGMTWHFIWWVPHFSCGMKLVSNKMPSHTFCRYHHLDFIKYVIYGLYLFRTKIEISTRGTNSMPFLIFQRDHLRSTSEIICCSGSFEVQFGITSSLGIIYGLDHLRCCTDLSSALVGMLMSSSKLFLFFEQTSLKLRCETVIGIVLCDSHLACCLLYYLCKINNSIHIYQFIFELLHFCFSMWLWFRIWTKILADRWIWWKKGTDQQICIPLFTPLLLED